MDTLVVLLPARQGRTSDSEGEEAKIISFRRDGVRQVLETRGKASYLKSLHLNQFLQPSFPYM